MGKTVKIRAWEREGMVSIKAIIAHPMENGLRKIKKTGKKIPPHYIREVGKQPIRALFHEREFEQRVEIREAVRETVETERVRVYLETGRVSRVH